MQILPPGRSCLAQKQMEKSVLYVLHEKPPISRKAQTQQHKNFALVVARHSSTRTTVGIETQPSANTTEHRVFLWLPFFHSQMIQTQHHKPRDVQKNCLKCKSIMQNSTSKSEKGPLLPMFLAPVNLAKTKKVPNLLGLSISLQDRK